MSVTIKPDGRLDFGPDANRDKVVAFLGMQGREVLMCIPCAIHYDKNANGSDNTSVCPVFGINLGVYKQTCHVCDRLVYDGGTNCELFSASPRRSFQIGEYVADDEGNKRITAFLTKRDATAICGPDNWTWVKSRPNKPFDAIAMYRRTQLLNNAIKAQHMWDTLEGKLMWAGFDPEIVFRYTNPLLRDDVRYQALFADITEYMRKVKLTTETCDLCEYMLTQTKGTACELDEFEVFKYHMSGNTWDDTVSKFKLQLMHTLHNRFDNDHCDCCYGYGFAWVTYADSDNNSNGCEKCDDCGTFDNDNDAYEASLNANINSLDDWEAIVKFEQEKLEV